MDIEYKNAIGEERKLSFSSEEVVRWSIGKDLGYLPLGCLYLELKDKSKNIYPPIKCIENWSQLLGYLSDNCSEKRVVHGQILRRE